jgi:hypothetical protein
VGRFVKLITVAAALGAGIVARRVSARTGATAAEAIADRPGDDIIPKPTTVWNRGTTIAARPDEIWPWLVQMGYGRAGFYVPEWIDRLVWQVPAANREQLLPYPLARVDQPRLARVRSLAPGRTTKGLARRKRQDR